MLRLLLALAVTAFFAAAPAAAQAARLVLPQNRSAYYCDEPIELAVAGLPPGAEAIIELVPKTAGLGTVRLPVKGDGSTVAIVVPPNSLAPATYTVKLGDETKELVVSSGVVDSTFLISQTIPQDQLRAAGANFMVGNAFSFGQLKPDQTGPLTEGLRNRRSPGLDVFDRAVAANLPTVCYMYWTGYVTHKPFGSQKSWAADSMTEAMRLLSFHTAQRLRRYERNIVSVGTIDEPGLGWGKTPGGLTASGFPDWDETAWYESRGWKFTNDPASRPADDWLKYMTIRCGIIAQQQARARDDLKSIWPGVVFSTDLYAPHAIMDGTDPLAQEVNDIPASHVFVDWGIDRLGAYSGVMLEKSHDPTSKLAHAMNGQLFAERVPQPQQSYAYRAALNGMLAAGLTSNWWLNTGGMSPEELAAVNEPARRMGPVLMAATPGKLDVAVLWSFTELAMREKEITAKEAHRQADEKITRIVTDLPENSAVREKEIPINAYNVGGDYKETVLTAHYAASRAGFPAHIVHERILPSGILKNYRVLILAGQTHVLPDDVTRAIQAFVDGGGRIVVDRSTSVAFPGAATADLDLSGLSYRWNVRFTEPEANFKSLREASSFQTNDFMDEPVRQAVGPLKAALEQAGVRPIVVTDSTELLVERHTTGDGEIIMVASGHEELPEIPETQRYHIYNYAPHHAKFRLNALPEGAVVYVIEGGDWSKTRRLDDPQAEIDAAFEPAEMKLFLVARREPTVMKLTLSNDPARLAVAAELPEAGSGWPLTLSIKAPDGTPLYRVWRATGPGHTHREQFPLGANASQGTYTVELSSPLPVRPVIASFEHQQAGIATQPISDPLRIFDAEAIAAFLKEKPPLTIVLGDERHRPLAEKLVASLRARGIDADIRAEADVLRKVHYPRVWNPYAKVYGASGTQPDLGDRKVEHRVTLTTADNGTTSVTDAEGQPVADWRRPHSVVTIAGAGYCDWIADVETCYEPGVVLYVDERRQLSVVAGEATEVKTTDEFRRRWARAWTTLTSHVGGYQLPPQPPEAWTTDRQLILLGDSTTSRAVAIVQASDLLLQVADADYPGPGKALVSFVWSPFAVGKNAILIAATDEAGLQAGIDKLLAQ
ncbi:MAG: hypothetical protein KY476_12020 [Planctomycetes bacterium]|nr:hypothetical protein [Planctomycetota bacterium]